MTINRKSDAFTHKVEYSFAGGSAVTVSSNATTSASFTPAVSLATNIPNSTIGSLTMKVTTFNGSAQIGDPVTKSVDLSVPSSVVPTMGNPTARRVDNGVPSSWGVYVKGYSQVAIKINSASGAQGSTVKSYSISGPNLNSNASSAKSDKLTKVGTNTYTCRITDSRGRTAEKTVSINVADYSLPSIKASAVRCSSDGSANKNGTYLKVTVDWNISSVSSKNSVSSRSVSCNGVSNTSFSDNTAFVLAANCSIGSSYTLTASVTDALGNSSTATVTIPTSSRVMNVRKNKDGLAIGKFSERAGFEVDWNSRFNGTVDINGKLTGNNAKLNGSLEVDGVSTLYNDLIVKRVLEYATPIPSNADLNTVAYLKNGQYLCSPNNVSSTITNSPTNISFKMIVYSSITNSYDNESSTAWVYKNRILIDLSGAIWVQYAQSGSTPGDFTYGPWQRILDNTNYKDLTAFTYSTSEQWTGEYWIDGKKIYTRTFKLPTITTSPTETTTDLLVSDINRCWIDNSNSYLKLSGNQVYFPLGYYKSQSGWFETVVYIAQVNGRIAFSCYRNSNAVIEEGYATLKYTYK